MSGKQNAVHKADVKVGSTYAVKVSGRIVPVTIDSSKQVHPLNPFVDSPLRTIWYGINKQTGKQVTIRSAAKLRYELVWSGPVDLNTKQGGRWVRKDSPIVFELLNPDGIFPEVLTQRAVGSYVDPGTDRVLRDVTPDELAALCGEDAPEQCQEFEDESGRWRRV